PPVYLGPKQLADLANIRIIDEGRRFARVYIAGEIEPIQINAIAEKLALAGVQEAKLYKGITDREPENWRDYLQRIREQAERGEVSAMKLVTKNSDLPRPALNQMGASQRGEVLLEYYGRALAINDDSDVVHHYNGIVWEPVSDKELQRSMAKIFIDAGISYSQNAIKFAVDTMKLSLPVMGGADRNLIGFSNGVFDTRTGNFREHNKNDWLLNASELPFSPPAEGETLATHAPNFWKWLRRSVANNDRKADRVLAALFMVLANRYDWQLFLEVTGPGGSGKSVMAEICTMLAGKANTVSASMKALEDARERALVVGFSLIIMPDMTRYAGDGAGIKAITGGDKVAIDPKHKAPYSTRIPAVVLAVNNNAMSFSDRSGGISRRRVIFSFSEVVPENERDPMLAEKIEGELAVVIRHLLTRFNNQDEARRLLYEQQKSEEALAIKREGDSLVDFCGYLMSLVKCEGMMVGNAEIVPFSPRRYLYHAYLAYMSAHGLGKPVSLTRFGTDMPGAMAEYGKEYKRAKCTKGPDKGRTFTNVLLDEDADGWLPAATGINDRT
ncbi:DNA primase, partial [Escherichia coli]|nr:DNA primase [Escherichia coli]